MYRRTRAAHPYRHHLCLNRTTLISGFPLSHKHTPVVTVRSAISIRTSLINFVTIKDFSEICSNGYIWRQADRMRENRVEGRGCASVVKCVLPAAECVVLLFQSDFSLLDVNHLTGQILRFPTNRYG